ncbi:hypothetical protein M430DRAFT_276126 [Amorphotheca resinae ATCC 22711]|uniref:Uncharacterized protein n=1 Tax=Amorphotheca resinae ATCC 22711 TaxID=857342 RepID=A0A2T3B203_AMORE|nr:hypothetical protein M430DRAFT_276126 [Amorphotheca resinae ATCC 22711]PSS18591.1 hypothetical protein M430DRAFT_276126 [Amorphotheca resinae ATCC 22711]
MAPTSNVDLWSLLVIAWGGMHFLLLCNASPAMCKPTCNDVEYSRTIWIELDSQILNAHLCLTGFGMAIPRPTYTTYFNLGSEGMRSVF